MLTFNIKTIKNYINIICFDYNRYISKQINLDKSFLVFPYQITKKFFWYKSFIQIMFQILFKTLCFVISNVISDYLIVFLNSFWCFDVLYQLEMISIDADFYNLCRIILYIRTLGYLFMIFILSYCLIWF